MSAFTAWALELALSIFTREVTKALFLSLATSFAKATDNKIDDSLVKTLKKAFDDED